MLSQLQSNYFIHSFAHSINTVCHSQVPHQKLFLQELFFPSSAGNVGSMTLVCQELRQRKLLWVTSWLCVVLHHTKSSHRPPHPSSCSSQPRLGSNWTMEFTSSRATGYDISVVTWQVTGIKHLLCTVAIYCINHIGQKSTQSFGIHLTQQVSQCCLTQLRHSATVVAGQG